MLLKNGSKGVQVTFLQYALHILCCSPKSFDGAFGAATEAAVKKYQGEYGFSATGQVNDTLWNDIAAEIKLIQRQLQAKGYYSGSIDGIAGEGTYSGVINFQKAKNLTPDGQVGVKTRQLLMRSGDTEVGNSDFPLKLGSTGDKVRYLQYGLKVLSCYNGTVDGTFGSTTQVAVEKFQTRYSLTVDGIVGSGTWGKMETMITEIQQALVNKGYSIGSVDGVAGPGTYEGVQEFQRDNGLVVDGMVGPATREKLLGSASGGGTDTFPLKRGSKGPYVLYLQYGLRILCINPNGLDGGFGAGTETAVTKFQTKQGITADGICGVQTWEALRTLIRPIQQALVNHGYDTGGVDGIAGEKTYNAVLAFQSANGLTADGMVGNATKEKLGVTGSGGGSGTTSSVLKKGSNGSLTKYLQRILNALGYTVDVDGVFGSGMETAVIAFQSANGLTADGIVGSGTWSKIFNKYKVNAGGSGVTKMVNVAKHELAWAFQEDNDNNITPYGEWYGMNGQAWCAMFVSWCASQAGILGTTVPRYAYCPSGMQWYKDKGKFYSRSGGYVPRIGDTVFFWSTTSGRVAHTGIVVGVTDTHVTTIEGNTSNGVKSHTYNRTNTYIHGYGCNGGQQTVAPPAVTKEEKEKAVLKKCRKLFSDCGLTTRYDATSNKLVFTDYEGLALELPIDGSVKIPLGPNLTVTCKIGVSTKLSTADANWNYTFTLDNGNILSSGLSMEDAINTVRVNLDGNSAEFLTVIDNLRLGANNGTMKIGVEYGVADYFRAYIVIENSTVEVVEGVTQTYSISYEIEYRSGVWGNLSHAEVQARLEECRKAQVKSDINTLVFCFSLIGLFVFPYGELSAVGALIELLKSLLAEKFSLI